MAKTLRVHTLAKELGVTSKQIIEKCRAEGIDLKNHMAAISAGLEESIREWFSVGDDVTSIEVADRVDVETIRKVEQVKTRREEEEEAAVETPPAAPETPAPEVPITPVEETAAPAEPEPLRPAASAATEEATVEPEVPVEMPSEPALPEVAAPTDEPEYEPEPQAPPERPPVEMPKPITPEKPRDPVRPAGPQVVPKPAELRGPRVVRIEAPDPVRAPRPRPAAQGPLVTEAPGTGAARRRGRAPTREEEDALKRRTRSPRRHTRGSEVGERLQEWREQDIQERRERLASATGHGLRERRAAEQRRQAAAAAASTAVSRKAPIEISAPIMLKEFCGAVGVPFGTVSKKLMEHTGRLWTINQSLDAETAELIALELGVSIKVARDLTAFEELQDEFEQREREDLRPRAPVVAMLGHVDHGKTSLLDAIRKTDVAAGEAGGITQHISAYRVDRDGWQVTFLDTPGHAAFTAMRARGANMTDVVVLVVAADDGVMPQTVEALNHARAAGVQIVVALNKIDLPNVDLNRLYAQLSEHGLVPSEWGGETDVIKTSATTGEGVEALIAHLSTLSELMDLKADPTVPAHAVVIESQMLEGKGVVANVLVREGTLKQGDIVVCGPAAGRVRSIMDDKGRTRSEALPTWPVQISGLDELPQSGDRLYKVDDLKTAKEIAGEVRQRLRDEILEAQRKPKTLEELLSAQDQQQIPELNVIVRADVQGSVDVLKQALNEFPSNKAHLNILHASVGAISEADVSLARASEGIIIGFYVVAEERARQLADQLGVEIRLYRVIYEILNDMEKALAGLLDPVKREETRGRADVRQVFNITRVGSVAGCYVTSGVVARNHRARLIRDGVIVTENRGFDSLKRFKDDVREVRNGLECGIKLDGFDDIKPGDVIETYVIVEEAQSL